MKELYEALSTSRKLNSQRGFTLIELLVVVAIIAILAAIAIPQFGKYRRDAAINACKADLRNAISMCAAALAANPTANNCTAGTDYPDSTENASSISITVGTDGTITGTATCAGAANGVTCSATNAAGSIDINCS